MAAEQRRYTVPEAAKRVGRSQVTVRRWLYAGLAHTTRPTPAGRTEIVINENDLLAHFRAAILANPTRRPNRHDDQGRK